MERNMAIKKALDENNFSGSTNAKQMKADMYMKMFKDSTDLDHSCRASGVGYLRCVQDSFKDPQKSRAMKCMPAFSAFDACRSTLLKQQASAVENSLVAQDIADKRAKALFQRRAILLDTLSHK